jgi:hypothetical protein
MDKQPSNDPKKVFDVMRPGTSDPSPTSRPIIGGQALQPDPMVVAQENTTPVVVEPGASVSDSAPAVNDDTANPPVAATENPTPDDSSSPTPEESQPAATEQPVAETPQPLIDSSTLANPPEVTTLQPETVNQQIVVHHNKSLVRRRVLLAILLLLVLAIVALDLLLDANVIKTSMSIPHSHFFGN